MEENTCLSAPLVADLVINLAVALQELYSYLVPVELVPEAALGRCALVSFHGREVLGIVARLRTCQPGEMESFKPISLFVEGEVTIDGPRLQLAEWMAAEYHAPLSRCVNLLAPVQMHARIQKVVRLTPQADQRELFEDEALSVEQRLLNLLRDAGGELPEAGLKARIPASQLSIAIQKLKRRNLLVEASVVKLPSTRQKLVQHAELACSHALAEELMEGLKHRAPKQAALLAHLMQPDHAVVPLAELLELLHTTRSAAKSLSDKGIIRITDRAVRRDPFTMVDAALKKAAMHHEFELTSDQAEVLDTINTGLDTSEFRQWLLFGVTASGKTEVYLRAIEHCLKQGRSALLLVPEIALTSQLVQAVRERFGELAAVLHSALSNGQRFDEWQRVAEGEAPVVVGARSAVFAPLKHMGLIILDEEHEATYKQQDHSPRYHARDVALFRAKQAGAVLLLGSATPSIESYYHAEQAEQLLCLPSRVSGNAMPEVHIVDMREASRVKNSIFSSALANAITDTLRWREQVILLINRRAWAMFVMCRKCGTAIKCNQCAVSLAYHKADGLLRCHHCDYSIPLPDKCPTCQAPNPLPFGLGTERVEEEVQRLFPDARILRMDRDTTQRQGSHHELLAQFRAHEADILIGTQMVAKGLDFPNVTLVGVVMADSGLNLPDFRASERTFQLLTQVAGRAGRSQRPGLVFVQSFNPEHEAVVCASQHDYLGFYQHEIPLRRQLGYPPFSRLANLVVNSEVEADAKVGAAELVLRLAEMVQFRNTKALLMGPAPAPLSRVRGVYRYHCLVKVQQPSELPALLEAALPRITLPEGCQLSIDIDPTSTL